MKKDTSLIDNLIVYSLCALIVGLPFSNSVIEIAASFAIGLWLFKKFFLLRRFKLQKTPVNLPLFCYFFVVMLSLINSQFLMTSLKGLLFKTTEYVLLFFVLVEVVRTADDARRLVIAILISCALIGIDGLWQFATGNDFLRGYPIWSSGGRITASFKFPNGLGGWIITVMPLCMALALHDVKERWWRGVGITLSILLMASLVLNFTRGAWIALLPAIILLVWMKGDAAKKVLLAVLLAMLSGVLLLLFLGGGQAVTSYVAKGWSVIHRIDLAKLCIKMFLDHPFLGHGFNTFMSIYEGYAGEQTFGGISYAHNCYLQILVETGIFSLAAFVWILFRFFVSSLRDISGRGEGLTKVIQIGLIAGVLAYVTHSAIESNLYSLPLAVLFYYILGFAVGMQTME